MGRIGNAAETGGAGRLDIWQVGWKSLGKYWLTGAGLANFNYAYNEFADYAPQYRGLFRDPHNIYLGLFVEFGIIGISLMFITLKKHYELVRIHIGKYDADKVMLNATFWGILVSSMFLDTLRFKTFWLPFMMILMYRNVKRRVD